MKLRTAQAHHDYIGTIVGGFLAAPSAAPAHAPVAGSWADGQMPVPPSFVCFNPELRTSPGIPANFRVGAMNSHLPTSFELTTF
jgi:hypothetical protein